MTTLSAESEEALDRIVALSGRVREEIASDVLQRYAAWLQQETIAVNAAREAYDRGEWIEHEELFDGIERELSS